MKTYLKYTSAQKKTWKYFKTQKPFWSEYLTVLWKTMNTNQHAFLKCKGNKREKSYEMQVFLNSRKIFDKELRRSERMYNKNMVNEIDSICTENPRAFGDYIKKIGSRKVNQIPIKVYKDNELVLDPGIVADTWQKDFRHLYNWPINVNDDFDQDFYNDVLNQKILWENEMSQTWVNS